MRLARRAGKFGAVPETVDGIRFDSGLEARRYRYLRLLERAGAIKDLQCHPVYQLQPPFLDITGKKQRAINYEADFEYFDGQRQRRVVEDCKGTVTETAKLKMKMFAYVYGYKVDIVHDQDF